MLRGNSQCWERLAGSMEMLFEYNSQVHTGPQTALVEEEHICDHLYRNRLARRTHKAIHCACSKQASMRCSQSLPDASQHDEHREDQADRAPAEDIAQGHDNEVCEAKSDDGDAGKH
jgi:hypothetical protein